MISIFKECMAHYFPQTILNSKQNCSDLNGLPPETMNTDKGTRKISWDKPYRQSGKIHVDYPFLMHCGIQNRADFTLLRSHNAIEKDNQWLFSIRNKPYWLCALHAMYAIRCLVVSLNLPILVLSRPNGGYTIVHASLLYYSHTSLYRHTTSQKLH